jgi:hypothetical protein
MPIRHQSRDLDLQCWVSSVGPPIVWATAFETRYVLSNPVHRWEDKSLLFLVSGVAVLLSLGCAWLGWRALRQLQPGGEAERPRFMLQLGVASGLFFALVMLAEAIPAIVLRATD